MTDKTDPTAEYLGDGVYASYDGFGVSLRVNDHRHPVAAYIEPKVMANLISYFERMAGGTFAPVGPGAVPAARVEPAAGPE